MRHTTKSEHETILRQVGVGTLAVDSNQQLLILKSDGTACRATLFGALEWLDRHAELNRFGQPVRLGPGWARWCSMMACRVAEGQPVAR